MVTATLSKFFPLDIDGAFFSFLFSWFVFGKVFFFFFFFFFIHYFCSSFLKRAISWFPIILDLKNDTDDILCEAEGITGRIS